MDDHNPIDAFVARVPWSRYQGATVALAAYQFPDAIRLVGARVVLCYGGPPSEWTFHGAADHLLIERLWLPIEAAQALARQLASGVVQLPTLEVALRREPSASPYLWDVQPYYDYLRRRIGWPTLQLTGMGDSLYHMLRPELFRELGRRLPSGRPKPFTNWEHIGAFLGGEGSALEFAESKAALLEFAAPSAVRIGRAHATPAGEVRILIEGAVTPVPGKVAVSMLAAGRSEPDIQELLPGDSPNGIVWEVRQRFRASELPVKVTLIVDGETVEDAELSHPRAGAYDTWPHRHDLLALPHTHGASITPDAMPALETHRDSITLIDRLKHRAADHPLVAAVVIALIALTAAATALSNITTIRDFIRPRTAAGGPEVTMREGTSPSTGSTLLFETFDADHLPPGWIRTSLGGDYALVSVPQALHGRSLRIVGPCTFELDLGRLVPLERLYGKALVATAMVRSTGIQPIGAWYDRGKFHLACETRDGVRRTGSGDNFTSPTKPRWQSSETEPLVVSLGATRVDLMVGIQDNVGTVWLDDLRITVRDTTAR